MTPGPGCWKGGRRQAGSRLCTSAALAASAHLAGDKVKLGLTLHASGALGESTADTEVRALGLESRTPASSPTWGPGHVA